MNLFSLLGVFCCHPLITRKGWSERSRIFDVRVMTSWFPARPLISYSTTLLYNPWLQSTWVQCAKWDIKTSRCRDHRIRLYDPVLICIFLTVRRLSHGWSSYTWYFWGPLTLFDSLFDHCMSLARNLCLRCNWVIQGIRSANNISLCLQFYTYSRFSVPICKAYPQVSFFSASYSKIGRAPGTTSRLSS